MMVSSRPARKAVGLVLLWAGAKAVAAAHMPAVFTW